MIEDSIIRDILDCWAAAERRPHGDFFQSTLPTLQDAKAVFETVFLASFTREEERPIHCSVVLASPSDIDDPSHRWYRQEFDRFAAPLLFTAESVAKLAPAFDPLLSSIAVNRDSSSRELQCWGVFNYSAPTHPFDNPTVSPMSGTCYPPDLFTLTTRNPGSVQVSRNTSNVGWFTNGVFIPAVPTPLTSHSLGRCLIQSLESTDLWEKYGSHYWHYYGRALETLLSESCSRGHGAIIILLASGDTRIPEHLTSKVQRLEKYVSWRSLVDGISQHLKREYLQRLAQLSIIDGALILSRELELLGFGAHIQAPEWTGKTLEGPNGRGYSSGKLFDAKRYGLRHNTAINFAAACEGSVVFVISQDGPVRAFTRSD
jgi:Probable sensor domain DACNV